MDGLLSAYAYHPEDLTECLAKASITAEGAAGGQRFEFSDGSAVIVDRNGFHVGFFRQDCENEALLEALVTVIGGTLEEAEANRAFRGSRTAPGTASRDRSGRPVGGGSRINDGLTVLEGTRDGSRRRMV